MWIVYWRAGDSLVYNEGDENSLKGVMQYEGNPISNIVDSHILFDSLS